MTTGGGSGQHAAVLTIPTETLPSERRPQVGEIAILPDPEPFFVEAVEQAGGLTAPLSDQTRAVIWLSYERAHEMADVLDAHPGIGWVQLPWAGVDAFAEVMRQTPRRNSILWTSAKGSYAQPVAEHCLALMLALLRGLPERVRAKSWGAKFGRSLYGLEVLIVGAGGIAVELIRLLTPFQVRVTVVRRRDANLSGANKTVTTDLLQQELPKADIVVIAAAMTEQTRHLFGKAQFDAMKPGAILVNVARGGLIDTKALVEAIVDRKLFGAGLDVTDPEPLPDGHPLWGLERVLMTPHSADTPEMTRPLLASRIRRNVKAFLDDSRFEGIVDPEAGY
ncbi:MAG: D-isomer specific 2-hydroxyacid dehydrogenase family protein [Homoserinimonas sp.]|nr:D-isomer specific 2-hydroxyacid dehydrogenase family protein [Homoserinimonas sp.]